MNTFNAHAEPQFDEDDDEFGDVESRPLLGWLLMAVALVAMAFLVGAGPQATARQLTAPAAPEATAPAPVATATVPVAPQMSASEAAGLAYGG
jgi:hypothetical protein